MKSRRILGTFGIAFLALALIAFICGDTLLGICAYKFGHWAEEAYSGKPLTQLDDALLAQNRVLHWSDPAGFTARTGRTLKTGQRLMSFQKGRGYSWFWVGTAMNFGYVVIQRSQGGDVVVDVVRAIELDSL